MKFENLSLSKKLNLSFLLYLLSFCLFMGASLIGFNFIKGQFDEVAKDSVPDIVAILELKSVSKRLFAEIQGFVATGDMDEAEEFYDSVELFDVWLERWDIHADDIAEGALKQKMLEHKQTFEDYASNIFKLTAYQQQLIERFDNLYQAEGLFEQSVSNKLNYFFRLTYLTVLSSSENEEDNDDDEQHTAKNADDAGEMERDERLEEVSEELLVIAVELEDGALVQEIVELAYQLVQTNHDINEYLERVEDYEVNILDTLDLAVELQNNEVENAFLAVSNSVKSFVLIVSLIGLIALALCFYVYQQIRKFVSKRLDGLVDSTQRVANGDLEHETTIYGGDEFGLLSKNFNQMTSALRKTTVSKDYFDNLLASMTESLIVVSKAGIIKLINEETLSVTRYQRRELLGQHLSLLLPNAETFLQQIPLGRGDKYRTEGHYLSKMGEPLVMLLSSTGLFDASGNSIGQVIVASDVKLLKEVQQKLEQANTNLKATQSQLIQSSKLASIGELSAGVAHELNQPLMIIRNGGQLLERRIKKGTLDNEKLHKFVDSVLSNSKRMMKIIDHLRTFSRHSSTEFVEVEVNNVVNNSVLMVGEQLKLRGIGLNILLSEVPLYVKGEPNQLEQVLLNLISNARDAMNATNSNNKQLTLSTRLLKSEQLVEIKVADNGCGIAPEILSKVFDPFYTTKDEGEGTGLGLSISYGIVSDHKGTINVESESEIGTSMSILLPVYQTANLQG